MAPTKYGRVFRFSLCLFINLCVVSAYEIPEVLIQALKPKGFRASIPDAPNIGLFAFQGNVNRPIENTAQGGLSGEVTEPTNGRWMYEDPNIQLKVGDVINYYVFVSVKSTGYVKDNLSFTVRALEYSAEQPSTRPDNPDTSPVTSNPVTNTGSCRPSATIIRGGTACSGQTIFEDNFNTFRDDVWQIEQYIPIEHPEYPFISYQRDRVSVSGGNLRITPKLQQTMPGFTTQSISTGELNLFSGCTGSANECVARASGPTILPPVASGRITSKGLAFTYGSVNIRAKFPLGDWLYPEILLEPFRKKYGMMFASGVINVARARGNKDLTRNGVITEGNKVLYGGPIMDFDCRQYLISEKKLNNASWADEFHVYTVNWTPEHITLLVDNEEWARVEPPPTGGLYDRFPPNCRSLQRNFLSKGAKMAPFDDHFYITLGVAAGGITEFHDDLYTQGFGRKPWRNQGRKASLNFWQAMETWLPTWTSPELLVDYVKVVAL